MSFCKQLEDYLINDQIELASKYYYLNENFIYKCEYTWDIASILCTYVNKHDEQNRLLDECGEFCLNASLDLCKTVATSSIAKELLIVYLENSIKFQINDKKFLVYIQILKYLLSNISLKQIFYSFESICGIIYGYIKGDDKLLPLNVNLNERDKQVFDHDTRVDRCCELTNAYIEFLEEFIFSKSLLTTEDDTFTIYKNRLINFILLCLMNLFDKPFAYLNLEKFNKKYVEISHKSVDIDQDDDEIYETQTIKTVKRAFEMIIKLIQNKSLYCLIDDLTRQYNEVVKKQQVNKSSDNDDDDDDEVNEDEGKIQISYQAICVFISTIHIKNIGLTVLKAKSNLPSVYTTIYFLKYYHDYIIHLLKQFDHQLIIEKGVNLLLRLFKNNQIAQLNDYFIENKQFQTLINHLFKLSIYTQYELIRKKCFLLLNLINSSFETLNGRFNYLEYYINYSLNNKESNNDNAFNNYIFSYMVYLVKNELHAINDLNCVNSQLQNLFRKMFKLNNDVECDLIDNSQAIIAVLNLLRYLIIRDKQFIFNCKIDSYMNTYLNDLQKAVCLSKAHYELEMRNLNENKVTQNEVKTEFEVKALNSKDETTSNTNDLTNQHKFDAINNALRTIDLIESLRVRCVELVDN